MNTRNSGLHDVLDAQRRADPLEQIGLLADLSQSFAQSLDIEDTLRTAVGQITEYMAAEAASVFLLDKKGEHLQCRACAGPVNITGLKISTSQGVVGRTFQSDACQLVKDANHDPDFTPVVDKETGFSTRTMVCTPLHSGSAVVGVLQVLNKQGGLLFDEQDRDALRVLAAPTSLAIHNARMAEDLVEQRRIRKELELARGIQQALLPRKRGHGFPLQGFTLPAREVSGDFYDWFELKDGTIAFTVGDVAGKGIDASLLMSRTLSLLRMAGKESHPPGEWLAKVNDELCETVTHGRFVCAVAGYYKPDEDLAVWASAGFPPALLLESEGRHQAFAAPAPPLGIVTEQVFPEQSVHMVGGRLHFYSDGVSEARTQTGELGVDGLRIVLAAAAQERPGRRMEAIATTLQALELRDDTTLLILQGREPENGEPLIRKSFNSCPSNLQPVRKIVGKTAEKLGIDVETRDKLMLVVDEAVANIIRHAYDGDSKGRIELSMWQQDDTLEIRLRDFAVPVDCSKIKPRDLDEFRPGGLGINFIDSVMDSWRFTTPESGDGNVLVMRKRIERA